MVFRLKEMRLLRGLSQETVARQLHKSQSAYSRLESGASRLYADELLALCRILACTPEDLLSPVHREAAAS